MLLVFHEYKIGVLYLRFSNQDRVRKEILNLSANTVSNATIVGLNATFSYCNVTVTYTHPGWNDTIHITIYLPPNSTWNGRFQGVGGGGWAASSGAVSLLSPVASNYAAGNTDAGHPVNTASSASWAFNARNDLNIPLLTDFASVALNDLAVAGKQLSNAYYGYGPRHSYWSGCSTGGRQGLMMAQRYPTAYDGIYAGSPAIHWPTFQVAQYWGQFVMNQLDYHPPTCIFDAITAAAVSACDNLDGVEDGVISALSLCNFDPMTIVNTTANCSGTPVTIRVKDAEIVQKVWEGPRTSDGTFLYWGLNRGAPFEGLTNTSCTSLTNCTGAPFSITPDWINNWVLANPTFNLSAITLDEFTSIFYRAYTLYDYLIGTDNPDLSEFKRAGGKMIAWHGLADQLIYPNGTVDYYQKVEARDPAVRDFYRFYEAPGVQHCGGGVGAAPSDQLDAVVDWVEKGLKPDTLAAVTTDGEKHRNLCQFPLVSVYKGGNTSLATSFACETSF
ncbi:tannase and feruloyl esterase [Mollisia scopiformis]|uniref:Carboxylic ester hydrolase n=1 Tax=Mollisia scopiformis TaxID=149040 RepID=A0A194WV30_MOLSC|nr:tannase and feruloyl esterase [Mollisia scopiformis]KUJ11524.1 tannase and feruloyl esterase [Mollisia scopiformis]